MTEFGENWRGWDFKVDADELPNVMTNPEKHVALVEINARPRELTQKLGAAANQLAVMQATKNIFYLSKVEKPDKKNFINPHGLTSMFPEHETEIMQLLAEVSRLRTNVLGALGADQKVIDEGADIFGGFAYRHRSYGHTDDHLFTIWLGASQPGFFIIINGQRIEMPSIPEGHALAFRGHLVAQELPALRHGVLYRSIKTRRAVLIGC